MAAVIRPRTPKFNLARAERIMDEAMVTVRCPACGDSHTVEPDADYLCPSCGEGQLVSPLRLWGLI